ncbi:hypothetical protein A3K86_14335 [Photobacterium jeanii]|uniref:DUF3108 domain-containing protein n=1 Tax=Photobacterium jeanii TaxID=858640 RepID=A0A178K9J6_9GAMM|nr:DUF3108 domain-containing protein [Photobacterium jeanii]OAN13736.1 hypothetical protein A3K86_14335 [Photobacterium jeanii]PST88858.1 DUF3108 domain-containing protein [Photobacterium jeanii]
MRILLSLLLTLVVFPTKAIPLPDFHQCKKTLSYQLYFSGLKVGTLERHVHWRGNGAKVYAYGSANVLVTKNKYNNQSQLVWSAEKQSFITQSFTQQISGLVSRNVVAAFGKDGQSATVTKDGETKHYEDPEFPLLDGDTLGTQLRLLLIQGKTKFDFMMQSTSGVNHYFFEVLGTEEVENRYGKMKAIKVRQTEVNDRQIDMWFAPELDYQLVKAKYKRNLLRLEAEIVQFKKVCPEDIEVKQTAKLKVQ